MKLNVFLLFGFSLILSHAASAQDATAAPADAPIEKSVVQTETVIEDRSFSSTSKIILDEAAIQKSRAPNITTLLSTQANIAVSTSNLQPGSIYLRGGDSGHILILVDGLPFYDASTVQRTMNLNEIDIKSIRRIEIIKGSQSVWYGGQALTGVIKIETFPKEIEKHQSATIEAGMRNYKKASAYGLQPLGDHDAVLARAQGSEKDNRSPMLGSEETYRGKLWSGEVGYLHQGDSDFFAKLGQLNDRNQITNTQFTPPGFTNFAAIDGNWVVSDVALTHLVVGWSGTG